MFELKTLSSFEGENCCSFCKTTLNDTSRYGPIYKYEDVIAHYYCLLFSSNLLQKGTDDEGILGFLLKDIKKELSRGGRLYCTFCKKNGALIGCIVKSCKIKFHFPCGLENQVQNLFFNEFGSFCRDHRAIPYIPASIRDTVENTRCSICLDNLPSLLTDIVWTPCCKTALYHKTCIQEVAVNSGYYFRCPNCNDEKLFRKQMLNLGIYIPDQDASWEMEPNAYSSLLERYNHCDAAVCFCHKGRDNSNIKGKWKIILCYRCLRKGIHKECSHNIKNDQWTCPEPCLSDTAARSGSDTPNIPVSLQKFQNNRQGFIPLSQTNDQNKENRDPNFNFNEILPNHSPFHAETADDAASDSSHLSRQKNNVCRRRQDFLTSRRPSRNHSFVNKLPSLNSKQVRNSFRSFPVNRSVLPSDRPGRRKNIHRIKKIIDEVQHPKKKSLLINNCELPPSQSAAKRGRPKKKEVRKIITSNLAIIDKRRRRYLIDRQVVRVYPTVFKWLKDFEICLLT